MIRVLRPLQGAPRLRVIYEPRLGYAEYSTRVVQYPRFLKAEALEGPHESVYLYGSVDLAAVRDWSVLCAQVKSDIMERGWSGDANAFTQSYGSADLDASNLLFQRLGFVVADDPRWVSTVKESFAKLCRNGLMYRYLNPDDFGEPKSSFTVCSFWMVQALHSIGENQRAREMFESLLGCGNHLGLPREDLDFATRRLLGNFPQAYSHLAIIDTAFILDETSLRAERLFGHPVLFDIGAVDPANEQPRWR